LQIVSESIK